jgi:hypothetical protein
MSWGAQNRSKDAKTPSVAGVRSDKPELGCCPVQPYRVDHIKSPAVELGLVWLCWPTPVSFFSSGAANGIELTVFIGPRWCRPPAFRYY